MCWWATFRKLGTCSTSEVLSPRTVLTENICESVQQILQRHKQQQQNAQLTEHDEFLYWSSSCPVCWWATFRKLGTCSTSEVLSPRTVLTENICESVQQILQHSPAQNIIAQLTKHDAFVDWSSSSPMWWWATARKLGRRCSGLFHVGGPLA